ncbi:MAG: ribonuclease P protein component [Vicingaceae bacterium]
MSFGLPKKERIYLKEEIQELFKKGRWSKQHPIRLVSVSRESEAQEATVKMGVSVPKKNLKRAVDRNKIKRLIKESYRLHKKPLLEKCKKEEKSCLLMFVYGDKELLPYPRIEKKIILLLQELEAKI